jgi:hypothetical protein
VLGSVGRHRASCMVKLHARLGFTTTQPLPANVNASEQDSW